MSNLLTIRRVGAESFHSDAPKNRRKLNYLYRYISVLISSDDRRNQHKTNINFLDFLVTMAQSNALSRFSLTPRLARLCWPQSTHSTCTKLIQSWQMLHKLFTDSKPPGGGGYHSLVNTLQDHVDR
jgi:hypothetical protein